MATWQTLDWYDAPKYYDAVFDEGTAHEADFLEAALERFGRVEPARGRRVRRVLEPACGSGRLVVEMARRDWRVHGFDLSQPMLDHAHGELVAAGIPTRRAHLWAARMQDFASPERFELAHCLVSTFKYLLTEADARRHLELVAEHLVPGGIYVLGFHLTDYDDTKKSRERWVAARDDFEVTCTIQGWPAERRSRTEQVRSRLVVEEGGATRRLETVWDFRTYDAAQVKRLLRSVPALELVATFDMTFDLEDPRKLDDEQLDLVLVLRRR
jgi:SAM-dependent methyltransferase